MVVFILFTRATCHTEPPAVSNQLHAVFVHPHQTDWVNIGENATVESAGSHLASQNKLNSHPSPILSWKSHKLKKKAVFADLAIHVGDAAVALCCSIELANLCHPKTLCEGLPHTGAQPVSHRQPNFVSFFWRPYWLRQEVAADLPNILHYLHRDNIVVIVACSV